MSASGWKTDPYHCLLFVIPANPGDPAFLRAPRRNRSGTPLSRGRPMKGCEAVMSATGRLQTVRFRMAGIPVERPEGVVSGRNSAIGTRAEHVTAYAGAL